MSAVPDEAGFWAKLAAGASGVVLALVGVVWSSITHRLSRHDLHIEKLYQNAEADRKLVRDLHDDAMRELRKGHHEIVQALTRLK